VTNLGRTGDEETDALVRKVERDLAQRKFWSRIMGLGVGVFALAHILGWFVDPDPAWLHVVWDIATTVVLISLYCWMDARVSVLEKGMALVSNAMSKR